MHRLPTPSNKRTTIVLVATDTILRELSDLGRSVTSTFFFLIDHSLYRYPTFCEKEKKNDKFLYLEKFEIFA